METHNFGSLAYGGPFDKTVGNTSFWKFDLGGTIRTSGTGFWQEEFSRKTKNQKPVPIGPATGKSGKHIILEVWHMVDPYTKQLETHNFGSLAYGGPLDKTVGNTSFWKFDLVGTLRTSGTGFWQE